MKQSTRNKGFALPAPRKSTDTLVLYVFSNTDTEYEANLRFFLKYGVQQDDGCDYLIILQQGGASKVCTSSHPRSLFLSHFLFFKALLFGIEIHCS